MMLSAPPVLLHASTPGQIGGSEIPILTEAGSSRDAGLFRAERSELAGISARAPRLPKPLPAADTVGIHLCGFTRGDVKEVGIESADMAQEAPPGGVGQCRCRLRRAGGGTGHHRSAGTSRPRSCPRANATASGARYTSGKPTSQADNGDRFVRGGTKSSPKASPRQPIPGHVTSESLQGRRLSDAATAPPATSKPQQLCQFS